MRILIVHNEYQQLGGEEIVVRNEQSLLSEQGHDVHLFSVSNNEIQTRRDRLTVALNLTFSRRSKERVGREIARFKPDLVHVHNFFPILTPAIYDACIDAGIPTVQTLHNYRLICAAALLMRQGRVCEDCIHGSAYQAVIHGCYRNSRLASIPVAHMVETHRRKKTWSTKVTRFIALTQFAKRKFIEAGFPEEKITVKLNFIPDPLPPYATAIPRGLKDSPRALYVGRLSPEKGLRTLLRAWKSLDIPLRIIGEGPLLGEILASGLPNIEVMGKKSPPEIAREMQQADFLIMPSECYEGFALVLIEAFANGLPVIASGLGSLAEIVEDQRTGLHFAPGSPENLLEKVRFLSQKSELRVSMGVTARKTYEQKYTPEINYNQLMQIYRQAIGDSQSTKVIDAPLHYHHHPK